MRNCALAVMILLASPALAFAHGEQILIFPLATVVLLILAGVGLLAWRESRRLKAFLLLPLFVIHFSLWSLPISVFFDHLGRLFFGLVALPFAGACVVYLIVSTSSD